MFILFFFFKQKTAYDMRISDWSSDVCSSDLPVVAAPAFAIRKPAVAIFTLDDYAEAGIMSRLQAAVLRKGVADRSNILVAGGTSTGKTTLTNALLAGVAKTSVRVVLIEDTRELQCASPI